MNITLVNIPKYMEPKTIILNFMLFCNAKEKTSISHLIFQLVTIKQKFK